MKKIIFSTFFAFASCTLGAQSLSPEVLASAGESFSDGTVYLDWTLGELMTETYVGTLVLTQGFHQPIGQATSIEANNVAFENVKVYPNPTSGSISIELGNSSEWSLQLFDMRGVVVAQKTASSPVNQLDLSSLPTGIYVLRLSNGKQATKSIRVKKL